MLTEEEGSKLDRCIDNLNKCAKGLFEYNLLISTQQWMANRLKEINDECSKVTEELQKANEEIGRLVERFD